MGEPVFFVLFHDFRPALSLIRCAIFVIVGTSGLFQKEITLIYMEERQE
jgi:hypothetical protein